MPIQYDINKKRNKKEILKEKLLFYEFKKYYYNNKYPFFKQFNYTGYNKLGRISSVNRNGLIDFDINFFYNRIQKAANTSTTILLNNIKYGVEEFNNDNMKEQFSHPTNLGKEQINKFDDLYKFTFVRNPYTRILSSYLHKFKYRNKYKNDDKFTDMYFPDLNRTPTFEEFVNYLNEERIYYDSHWAPQTSLLLLPLEKFDYVGNIETYKKDIRNILANINVPTNYEIEMVINESYREYKSMNHSTGASNKISKYYNDELANKIKYLYKDEMEKLGYTTELPS